MPGFGDGRSPARSASMVTPPDGSVPRVAPLAVMGETMWNSTLESTLTSYDDFIKEPARAAKLNDNDDDYKPADALKEFAKMQRHEFRQVMAAVREQVQEKFSANDKETESLQQMVNELKMANPGVFTPSTTTTTTSKLKDKARVRFSNHIGALKVLLDAKSRVKVRLPILDAELEEELDKPFDECDKDKEARLERQRSNLLKVLQEAKVKYTGEITERTMSDVSKKEYKPIKLPAAYTEDAGKREKYKREFREWCREEPTIAKYGCLIPDLLLMLDFFNDDDCTYEMPRSTCEVEEWLKSDYDKAMRELFNEVKHQAETTSRSECASLIKGGVGVVGTKRRMVVIEDSNGPQALYLILQALESDSGQVKNRQREKLRCIPNMFKGVSTIMNDTKEVIEVLQTAERVGVFPTWDDCGELTRIALRQLDNSVRMKMYELSVPLVPADTTNCTKEIMVYMQAAVACRMEETKVDDLTSNKGGAKINIIDTFTAEMKGKPIQVFKKACKMIEKKMLTDEDIKHAATVVVQKAVPGKKVSAMQSEIKKVQMQLKNGQKLDLPGLKGKGGKGSKGSKGGEGGKGAKGAKGQKGEESRWCKFGEKCWNKETCAYKHSSGEDRTVCQVEGCEAGVQKTKRGTSKFCMPCYKQMHHTTATLKDGTKKRLGEDAWEQRPAKRHDIGANKADVKELATVKCDDGTELKAHFSEDQLGVMQAVLDGATFIEPSVKPPLKIQMANMREAVNRR